MKTKSRQQAATQFDKQINITVPQGISPFSVISSTLVQNLNTNYLEGHNSSYFAQAIHMHEIEDINGLEDALAQSGGYPPLVTETSDGLMSFEDKIKLNNIEEEANKYVHPLTHPANIITTNVSEFTILLSSTDTKVQLALNTLDKHNHDGRYATPANLTDYLPLTGGALTGELSINNGIKTKTFANQELGVRWVKVAQILGAGLTSTGTSDPNYFSCIVFTGSGLDIGNTSYAAIVNISADSSGTILPSVTSFGNRDYSSEISIPEFAIYTVDNGKDPDDAYIYYKIPSHSGKTTFLYQINNYIEDWSVSTSPLGAETWSSIHNSAQDIFVGKHKVYNENNLNLTGALSTPRIEGEAQELIESGSLLYIYTDTGGNILFEKANVISNKYANGIAVNEIQIGEIGYANLLGINILSPNTKETIIPGVMYYIDSLNPGCFSKSPPQTTGVKQLVGIGTNNGIYTFISEPEYIS